MGLGHWFQCCGVQLGLGRHFWCTGIVQVGLGHYWACRCVVQVGHWHLLGCILVQLGLLFHLCCRDVQLVYLVVVQVGLVHLGGCSLVQLGLMLLSQFLVGFLHISGCSLNVNTGHCTDLATAGGIVFTLLGRGSHPPSHLFSVRFKHMVQGLLNFTSGQRKIVQVLGACNPARSWFWLATSVILPG